MPSNAPFQSVLSLRPGRSAFDLSYDKKLTCDMGQLIPIMCDEAVPGDVWNIAHDLVIRMQPMVAPILHEVNAFIHVFFVPYRLLWPKVGETGDDWESFITGGADGQNAAVLPRWTPGSTAKGTLWDFLGLPIGVTPVGAEPLDFPRRAYNLIYNEYYRDQTLQTKVALTNENILNRDWEKDYFTSALPWQQRGTAPALPISGTTFADFTAAATGGGAAGVANNALHINPTSKLFQTPSVTTYTAADLIAMLNKNTVNFSQAQTFNVNDLRLAFQVQKWLERNARSGARYTEYLKSHFSVAPRDDRLQRPEYIGGSRSPVIISEVLQTGATVAGVSPQGNMAGHGLVASRNFAAKYHVLEFGLIMGLLSVMPVPAYQQGINRQWLRRTRFDFYSPEFAHLGEQAIEEAEVYAQGTQVLNRGIFGYQGRFDEMRTKQSQVCNEMRDTFAYWHLSRVFGSAPALNDTFLKCVPRKDVFAAQTVPCMIINVANKIKAIRPLPIQSEPGMLDH